MIRNCGTKWRPTWSSGKDVFPTPVWGSQSAAPEPHSRCRSNHSQPPIPCLNPWWAIPVGLICFGMVLCRNEKKRWFRLKKHKVQIALQDLKDVAIPHKLSGTTLQWEAWSGVGTFFLNVGRNIQNINTRKVVLAILQLLAYSTIIGTKRYTRISGVNWDAAAPKARSTISISIEICWFWRNDSWRDQIFDGHRKV